MHESSPLRVGVIGLGTIAQIMHLPYLSSLSEEFSIVALSDVSPGTLKAVAVQYGVPEDRRYLDFQDLVVSDLDAVFVLNGGSHAPQIVAALEAGRHVFVEKPLCFTLREADEIEAARQRSGRVVMVGYMKRFDPGFQLGRRVVREMNPCYIQINTLHPSEGQYIGIHATFRTSDVPDAVAAQLLEDTNRLLDEAVGSISETLRFVYFDVLLGSMVHDVNCLRALVGEPEEVMFAEIWPKDSRTPTITTVFRHKEDLRTVYTWSYLDDLRDYFEEIAVFSNSERVRIQFPSPFLKHWPTPVVHQAMRDGAMVESRIEVSHDEAFREEVRAFHAYVREDASPITDVADARADIALLQRVMAALGSEGLGGEAAEWVR